jgi:hypothetical protein
MYLPKKKKRVRTLRVTGTRLLPPPDPSPDRKDKVRAVVRLQRYFRTRRARQSMVTSEYVWV